MPLLLLVKAGVSRFTPVNAAVDVVVPVELVRIGAAADRTALATARFNMITTR